MKVDRHLVRFATVALVVASVVALVLFTINRKKSPAGDKSWTVYGTKTCGWTNKQLEEMDNKGVSYDFVDCSSGKCDGIGGYPTLKGSDGTVKVGYTPM
jgi:hypothetical protein